MKNRLIKQTKSFESVLPSVPLLPRYLYWAELIQGEQSRLSHSRNLKNHPPNLKLPEQLRRGNRHPVNVRNAAPESKRITRDWYSVTGQVVHWGRVISPLGPTVAPHLHSGSGSPCDWRRGLRTSAGRPCWRCSWRSGGRSSYRSRWGAGDFA